MNQPTVITSRDNPTLRLIKKLAQDNTAYRKEGQIWIEGEHLCSAALARGIAPRLAVYSEDFWPSAPVSFAQAASKNIVVPAVLLREISGLESPAPCGFVIDWTQGDGLDPTLASVILDGVQDAGNVGSILRSASAFGFKQVIAIKGSAALWGQKVVRSGMGAHFALKLVEGATLADAQKLQTPLAVTSSHRGEFLHEHASVRGRLGAVSWIMGHEGQGVSPELEALAKWHVRIAQPGGEESLNVAAAAAICLHTSAVDCTQA
jgi:RNA methyltransferase, TrmH family